MAGDNGIAAGTWRRSFRHSTDCSYEPQDSDLSTSMPSMPNNLWIYQLNYGSPVGTFGTKLCWDCRVIALVWEWNAVELGEFAGLCSQQNARADFLWFFNVNPAWLMWKGCGLPSVSGLSAVFVPLVCPSLPVGIDALPHSCSSGFGVWLLSELDCHWYSLNTCQHVWTHFASIC